MGRIVLACVVWLCAEVALADFTYLSQSGSATASYSLASAIPPSGSASWTEPTGFVDYNVVPPITAGYGNSSGTISANCSMSAKYHSLFLELAGGTGSLNAVIGTSSDSTTAFESRTVVFRNDTAQLWPIVGVLQVVGGSVRSAAYSLKGSDGSDTELSAGIGSTLNTETDFNGSIKPGVTYMLSMTAASSIPGGFPSKVEVGASASFDVQIGVVPEPSTLASPWWAY